MQTGRQSTELEGHDSAISTCLGAFSRFVVSVIVYSTDYINRGTVYIYLYIYRYIYTPRCIYVKVEVYVYIYTLIYRVLYLYIYICLYIQDTSVL